MSKYRFQVRYRKRKPDDFLADGMTKLDEFFRFYEETGDRDHPKVVMVVAADLVERITIEAAEGGQ